jgi:hypothetical protein
MSFSCRSSNCRKARRPLRRCCQVRSTARPRARSAWIRCQTRLDGRVRTVRGYVAVFIITTFFWNVSCPPLASWRAWRPAPGPPAPPSRSAHQPCLQGDVAALPVLAAGRCQGDSGRLSPWLSCCARERVGAERCLPHEASCTALPPVPWEGDGAPLPGASRPHQTSPTRRRSCRTIAARRRHVVVDYFAHVLQIRPSRRTIRVSWPRHSWKSDALSFLLLCAALLPASSSTVIRPCA